MQKGGGHLGEGGGEAYSRPDNRVQGPVRRRETVQDSAARCSGGKYQGGRRGRKGQGSAAETGALRPTAWQHQPHLGAR